MTAFPVMIASWLHPAPAIVWVDQHMLRIESSPAHDEYAHRGVLEDCPLWGKASEADVRLLRHLLHTFGSTLDRLNHETDS